MNFKDITNILNEENSLYKEFTDYKNERIDVKGNSVTYTNDNYKVPAPKNVRKYEFINRDPMTLVIKSTLNSRPVPLSKLLTGISLRDFLREIYECYNGFLLGVSLPVVLDNMARQGKILKIDSLWRKTRELNKRLDNSPALRCGNWRLEIHCLPTQDVKQL